jgi:hypothetical protein
VDALAAEYSNAGTQVLFLEQDVDLPKGKRQDRWWASYTGSSTVYLPLVMVDSGHQISNGSQADFKATYRRLVDAELARPPQVDLEAYTRQVGARMRIYARLKNTAGITLSSASNGATLHALVWEDKRVGVTGRIVRAAPWIAVSGEVAPDGEYTATLETPDLAGVSWSSLHAVALADYRPGSGTAYDMLQGALAQPAALAAEPTTVTVAIEANDRGDRLVPLLLRGPFVLNFTASADVPWITVSPDAGPISAQPAVIVAAQRLSPGWQHGVVTFTASSEDGMSLAQTVPVSAFSGPRVLRIGTTATTAGSSATLSVILAALGDENAVAFSVAFDPTALTNPFVALGPDAGTAVLTTDASQAAEGRLGLSLALPAGQALEQGDAQVLVISFDTAPGAGSPAVAVRSSDFPVARAIVGADGDALRATYLDGAVLLTGGAAARTPRRHLAPRGP